MYMGRELDFLSTHLAIPSILTAHVASKILGSAPFTELGQWISSPNKERGLARGCLFLPTISLGGRDGRDGVAREREKCVYCMCPVHYKQKSKLKKNILRENEGERRARCMRERLRATTFGSRRENL
jgi:hypothetical protein